MCPEYGEENYSRAEKTLARHLVKVLSTGHHFPRLPMTTATRPPTHSFTMLLARYISGSVNTDQFNALCDLIEEAEATPAERLAFARYYLDATGEDQPTLPKLQEWSEIMEAARA